MAPRQPLQAKSNLEAWTFEHMSWLTDLSISWYQTRLPGATVIPSEARVVVVVVVVVVE